MTLEVALAPMNLEAKTFNVGDTIRVTVSFAYTVGQDTTITLQAIPYHYRLGILDRIGSCAGQKEVALTMATTPTQRQESIDFKLVDISGGTYGLLVEVLGTDFSVKQDSIIIVAGGGGVDLTSIMGIMVVVMMMGMVMPMMEEGEGL